MARCLELFLDLGDLFTKAVVVMGEESVRFRYPSAIAYRLLEAHSGPSELLLTEGSDLPRPEGFDPSAFPRTRSYPGAEEFLGRARPERGARYAGKLATKYGADRELLGTHPTEANVDALTRKALLLARPHRSFTHAEATFLVDAGPKSAAITAYVEASPRHIQITSWRFGAKEPEHIDLQMHGKVVDSADSAARGLPASLTPRALGRVLLVDIGYLRTKLTILTADGCALQRVEDGLGVMDCTRRILRDGQDQGLVEDEFAVIRALERSQTHLLVAGRTFDIRRPLHDASAALGRELMRKVSEVMMTDFARHAEACRGVIIIGGGAALVGPGLSAQVEASFPELETTMVLSDPWLPLEGAGGGPPLQLAGS